MIQGHGDDAHIYNVPIVSNFSSNVLQTLNCDGLKSHLIKHIEDIHHYPEPGADTLAKALAAYHHVFHNNVLITNGATQAIYMIAQAFAFRHSAILAPTFSEYQDSCLAHKHKLKMFYSIDTIPVESEIVWICNPNNPTGTVYEKEVLLDCIKKYSNKIFVLDQSYADFTLKNTILDDEAITLPNVIILHSMTKRSLIAGLRLGYMICHEDLMKLMHPYRQPWSVNAMAITAGLYLLEHPIELDLTDYLKETNRLRQALMDTKCIEVWPTDTHYMLCRLRFGQAASLKEFLAQNHGILIRDASNFRGLDNAYFRVCTQTKEENNRLLEAIKHYLSV